MRTLCDHLTFIVALLHHAIGRHLHRQATQPGLVHLGHRSYAPRPDPTAPAPLPGPVWELLYKRAERLRNRFTALFLRWQTNTLPKPKPKPQLLSPRARAGGAGGGLLPCTAPPEATPKPLRLPRAFGWINKRIPEAAPPAGTLEDLLLNRADEVQALLKDAPQAGRLLRPLAHALGVRAPAYLKLPPRPRKPRPPRPPRPDRPLPLTHPSLGLTPNIIRAVRYWRKKYGPD